MLVVAMNGTKQKNGGQIMSDGGKGSSPRPTDMEEFRKNWERIFGKPPVSEHPKPADNAHPVDEKH